MTFLRVGCARASSFPGLLALAVLLWLSALSSPGFAQEGENAPHIVVNGATRGDAETIKSYFTGADQASINRGIHDLVATGMFDKVSAKVSGDALVVDVVEGAEIINRVAFEGNKSLKGDQLAVEVLSKDFASFSKSVADTDIDRIRDAYKKIGHDDVRVTYRLVTLPNGRVDLVFKVDEGDKTGIREINFLGNANVPSWRLKGLMQATEMNWLSFFKTSDVYNPDTLAADEESIRKYYMRFGYADFRITDTSVLYVPAKKGYVITISLEEGAQYRVSGVSVTSDVRAVSGDTLARFATLRTGDLYNATEVENSVNAMMRELARRGYAFSEVRPHGQRDNVNHRIALAFTADNTPKVYIERIDIVGNTRTRDYVIRREFEIGEGDPYNHALLERGEHRLNNLDFFKSVHVSSRPGSAPDRVIVTIEVEDKPTGSVSISGGYSTLEGPLVELAFTETNFLGRGQYVRLSGSRGQYSNGWGVSFTEPYLFDQRLAGGIDLYHKQQLQTSYAYYETDTTGLNLRLGVPITEEITFQPNYSIYQSRIQVPDSSSQPYDDCGNPFPPKGWDPVHWGNTDYDGYFTPGGASKSQFATSTSNCLTNGEASAAVKEAAAQGKVLTSLIGYSWIWDNLDNKHNPSSGFHATFHQDYAGLGGDSHFVRETFDGRYYYPLTDDLTALLRAQAGRIDQVGGGYLPLLNNFNLGPSLIRGFAPNGFGPRDISDPNNISSSGLGGTTYAGGTAELQFPILGLPKEVGLKGAIFTDTGTLTGFSGRTNFSSLLGYSYCPTQGVGTFATVGTVVKNGVVTVPKTKQSYLPTQPSCLTVDDGNTIRTSAGASIIWASPLGPIRIDFAYPIIKGKYDQTQFINFSGGATF